MEKELPLHPFKLNTLKLLSNSIEIRDDINVLFFL